jgi:hypothetical protein
MDRRVVRPHDRSDSDSRPVADLALGVYVSAYQTPAAMQFLYANNGPATMSAALFQSGSTFGPVPGTHPVLAHQICAPDPITGQLRVLQQVIRSDSDVPTADAEMVQSFQVPVTVTAQWVELAVSSMGSLGPVEVSILDPAGQSSPPPSPLPTTETAAILVPGPLGIAPPVWAPTQSLATPAHLEPGHTYWLTVRTNQWGLRSSCRRAATTIRTASCTRARRRAPCSRSIRRAICRSA